MADAGVIEPDPRLRAALHGLALTARQLVAGAVAGLHPSRRPGSAREFSQYRAYQPGDEPRRIDWKLFARSDRYFLRESDVDTRVAVDLVVDATASMRHRGPAAAAEKFAAARALAAALGFLAETQGDPVSLHLVGDGAVRSLATAGRRAPGDVILRTLARAVPAGRWPADPAALTTALRKTEHDGASAGPGTTARLTVVITDGHQPDGEIRAALRPLRVRRHEVILLRLVARDETEFPHRGQVRFEEWETGRFLEAEAGAMRRRLLEAAAAERAAWRREWDGERFETVELDPDGALEKGLRACLRRRMER
ncbi:MAG: hypothetical protein B9S34_05900 [Opitutia bacterium Tous-C1TDCM]|nr:MAG: hypothetical protein B9S34_05900 [Opitutae bacterium Tous-C1TDCM]